MKERQRKKQQKRDAEKEKSGPIPYKQNTLVTKGSYDSYNNEPCFTIATSSKGEDITI